MALLVRVDEIVCLQQDLVVDAADVRIGMVCLLYTSDAADEL